jgi:hypothetical protein|tara:strand:- start:198 stop:869 length:672 start_codon:yes stop_codon:yes gene_type:complete
MAKRMTDTDKWKKRFVRELQPQHKLLWFYILDDCNHAGIWEVDIDVASIRVGFDLSQDDLPSLFGDKVISFDNGDKWFIPDFIEYQYGELNQNSNVHKSVINLLNKYNLEGYLKGSQRVESTLKDKDTDIVIVKDKAKAKRFTKPTVEDVLDYCSERNNLVDAEKFYDYYSSNGWKVGKNPMKDWKASVRTWEKNSNDNQKASQPKQVLTAWQQARTQISNAE